MRKLLLYIMLFGTTQLVEAGRLQRSTPEDEGIATESLQRYLDFMMASPGTTLHGVMVLRHGKVVAEAYNQPFKAQYGHTLYSCSKTFVAAAVGLCVQDSLLTLDVPVASFFPDEMGDNPSDTLSSLTVRHLLTMQSGWPVRYTELRKTSAYWTRELLRQSFVCAPGTRFAYDSMNSYFLSGIVQRASGRSVIDLLKERLFRPMDIDKAAWEQSPEGFSCGGWGLYVRLEDMAKFGQLLLQRGRWEDEQLLDSVWVASMMSPHVLDGAGDGYGLQMWMTAEAGCVQAKGAYGQHIFVMPDKDMVVVVLQNTVSGTGIDAEAEQFAALSQLRREVQSDARLPRNFSSEGLTVDNYAIPPTRGTERSGKHLTMIGVPTRVQLADNDLGWRSVTMSQDGKHHLKLTVTTREGDTFALLCGHGDWVTSKIKGQPLVYADRRFQGQFWGLNTPFYCAASYGWYGTSEDDLYVRLHYVNWISSCRLHFHFTGQQVTSVKIRLGYTNKDLTIPIVGY
ncbi:MAG: serine hydrolase [Bacteroidaceae bacterium]|nr:serine hydrolase [Bacteroidaceae bacterium]